VASKPRNDFQAQSAGFLANQMARLFTNALTQAIQPLGITPAQFVTLLELWRGDGLTQRDLVERLNIEQATMAGTLNRMERDGLITREPHPNDSRAQSIFLTERGRELQGPAQQVATEVNRMALATLTPDEQEELLALMHRVLERLRRRLSKGGSGAA
jgi:DNA-binding MarR family transcriptional regulator